MFCLYLRAQMVQQHQQFSLGIEPKFLQDLVPQILQSAMCHITNQTAFFDLGSFNSSPPSLLHWQGRWDCTHGGSKHLQCQSHHCNRTISFYFHDDSRTSQKTVSSTPSGRNHVGHGRRQKGSANGKLGNSKRVEINMKLARNIMKYVRNK